MSKIIISSGSFPSYQGKQLLSIEWIYSTSIRIRFRSNVTRIIQHTLVSTNIVFDKEFVRLIGLSYE